HRSRLQTANLVDAQRVDTKDHVGVCEYIALDHCHADVAVSLIRLVGATSRASIAPYAASEAQRLCYDLRHHRAPASAGPRLARDRDGCHRATLRTERMSR